MSPDQRDAIYDAILLRISGIDALHLAIQEQDFRKASALSSEFSDYLRVLNDDLGWGGDFESDLHAVAPADVWARVLSRLREQCDGAAAEVAAEQSELVTQGSRILRVRDHCDRLLEQM